MAINATEQILTPLLSGLNPSNITVQPKKPTLYMLCTYVKKIYICFYIAVLI
uniref:Uncharacterized protein n=1 Tax=Anguilla anguilla TaxID=7936 RepID=A0A0E9XJ74_ANGAN